ncbi:MAG: hypothetical protein ACI9VR_001619 [Cognaticolwellia sp.]|jgi:uncharacterized protein (TIGR01777 family)
MPKTIAITGASGLLGKALQRALKARGDTVLRFRRGQASGSDERSWSPGEGLDPSVLDGVDAVIHLAGEPISQRWTDAAKERILGSREGGTRSIAEAVAGSPHKPTLVCASAVGIYGADRPDRVDEGSTPGDDFLAQVCLAWESAAEPARVAGARVVHVRLGVVLSTDGGALEQMLLPFKLGVGGRVGDGKQAFPWVHIDDAVKVFLLAVDDDTLQGPVNAVGPEELKNIGFTKALGDSLGRWTKIPVPAAGIKLILGEMGEKLLLKGQNVRPGVLEARGFAFEHPRIQGALMDLLG